jgi:hypothetical protein
VDDNEALSSMEKKTLSGSGFSFFFFFFFFFLGFCSGGSLGYTVE